MTERVTVEHIFTTAEAVAFLKKTRGKGYIYWIGVDRELPIPTSEGKCFPGYAVLKISLSMATKFVKDVCGKVLEERGGRIQIQVVTDGDRDRKHVYL